MQQQESAHILSPLWYHHLIRACQIQYSARIRQTMIFLLLLQSAIVTGIQLWKWKIQHFPLSSLSTQVCCSGCILWWMHSRTGQWSQPDSPDGLALMGEVPMQHRLWQRPGVLHRRESVQTGVILTSVHLSYIQCSSDGRYAGHWRIQGCGIRHHHHWRLLAWSSEVHLILSVPALRNICIVHCQLILIIQISGGQTSTRSQKVSEWNSRSGRLYSQARIEVWNLWGRSRFSSFFLLVCCQGSIYSNRITVIWRAGAIRGYWDTWRMMPTLLRNGVHFCNING